MKYVFQQNRTFDPRKCFPATELTPQPKINMKLRMVLLFCWVGAFQITQSASQKYGTACGAGGRCDSRSGTVTCSADNVCSCPDSDTMIYDAQEDSCVVGRIGAICYTRSLKNGRPERTCVPGAQCIPVTSNSAYGICQSISSGGEKTLKGGESKATQTTTAATTTQTRKNKDGFLEGEGDKDLSSLEDMSDSTNGETSPAPVTQETTPHLGSRIGEVCQSEEDCFPSSSSCVDLFCTCDDGYIDEFGGTKCSRMINYSCEIIEATECIANSTCDETNACQCNSKFVMKNDNQQCALMINESCKSKDECLDNAECKSDGLSPDLVCMCEDGFPPAEDLTKCSGTSVNFHVALLAIGYIAVIVNKI
ncbi:unnamed protein product [Allacma fusca]|uniref:EGF-like domain-containing protein n=1 Tax=Allacma fusca TaxID=39272 RepID=A0A8J2KU17_9HEXA|nr:unnamed protein product [Allacma fusca]